MNELYPDGRACPVCSRRYGHLTRCAVAKLHELLDQYIDAVGVDNVMLVQGVSSKIAAASRVDNNKEEMDAINRS